MLCLCHVCDGQGTNPMFRFFSYDRATLKVIDFKQYWFNLTRSNELKTPVWEMGYSMKRNYNLNSLDPSDIMDLSMELAYNDQLWESFQVNYKGGYVPAPQLDRNGTVCHLLSTTYQEYEYCQKNAFPSAMKYDQWHQDVEKIL
ncbi:acid sphingomyelinase-like phosphodiesterase 3b [Reticulomyxa filosa]|uniref:Acid sphingomyelinase-like phosphodiesterase 3b n=1 Tax=Reticulomyxa filosa TaxID=46433 RepID=X6MQP9_RETFI|nr:acid sphingomyelinase-like phosphodiesterase 3b [Reticulomyxa filosa]|eukprot:ETO15772.1 acid sphingomyelinase-like phosphodiesterase 3b [Reticulomyxa filosa]